MPRTQPILVVSAFEPELSPLRRLAPPWVEFASIGIGLVAAAVGATRRILERKPCGVLFVGTCGVYGDRAELLETVVATSVHLVDTAVVTQRGAIPEVVCQHIGIDNWFSNVCCGSGLRKVSVANTMSLTTSNELGEQIETASNTDVEHLELFSFATVCEELKVPYAAMLGVANRVGSSGRREWFENNVEASQRVAQHVNGLFEALDRQANARQTL